MPLHDLLTAPRVAIMDMPAPDARAGRGHASSQRDRVLAAAAQLLCGPERAIDIAAALRDRERLASTALGEGVAIPHARCSTVEHCHGAFLRLTHPVDFNAADGQPVDLVLALLVPEHDIQPQLLRLAELAERFADPDFRRELRQARDIHELRHHLLAGTHPAPLPRAA